MIIEKTILDFLTTSLNVPVYMEVPRDPDESYVVIQKTGSTNENRITEATIAVQSIAPTLYGAAVLNGSVITALKGASLDNVFRIKLNSDYNFTNTTTKEYRYQAVFNITYTEV